MTQDAGRVGLGTIAREWLRIGVTGFGGPPAHINLLRQLCVDRRRWITATEFSDGLAAANLLPGPASTQLSIYCAWRLRGAVGAIVGGLGFILPGLVAILALSAVLLSGSPNRFIVGAAAGAGAAVAAVAVHAAWGLVPGSWQRVGPLWNRRLRWLAYLAAGAAAATVLGAWVVVVLIGSGVTEVVLARPRAPRPPRASGGSALLAPLGTVGGTAALCWTAFKVGALSYGGGFVIIPLMQSDAVGRYHWLTSGQFLYAVALGQITPGPVVHTVASVGYAAAGVGGGLLAALIAFTPSFVFVIAGARHFEALRTNSNMQAFLTGAGAGAIGAIAGSSVTLALSIGHLWQVGVLAAAVVWLLVLRRGVVSALAGAAALGIVAAGLGWPLS
jgi:chromate transporter